jgi:hypothetical protein
MNRNAPLTMLATSWFWMDAGGGYDSVWLRTFVADVDELTAELLPSHAGGGALSAALGARLWFVTIGARGRVTMLDGKLGAPETSDRWWLWRVGPEVGARIPLGEFEPHFELGAGYATIGGTGDMLDGFEQGLDIDGFYGAASAGFDYFLVEEFSLGLVARGDFLALARPGVAVRDLIEPKKVDTLNEARARILEADGSSYGGAFGVFLIAGLHL